VVNDVHWLACTKDRMLRFTWQEFLQVRCIKRHTVSYASETYLLLKQLSLGKVIIWLNKATEADFTIRYSVGGME